MKKLLPLVALAAVSSFAAPKFGIDAAGLLTMPNYTGEGSLDTKLGFGVKVAPAAQFDVNEKLAVRASVGYEFTTWGLEESTEGGKMTFDCKTHQLAIGADAVFAVVPQVQLLAGVGAEIPLSGSYDLKMGSESENSSGDIEDTQTAMFLEAGAGYALSSALSVNAKYKFALGEYSKDAVKLNHVQVGVSYNFGN